jgi:hypothetical protein
MEALVRKMPKYVVNRGSGLPAFKGLNSRINENQIIQISSVVPAHDRQPPRAAAGGASESCCELCPREFPGFEESPPGAIGQPKYYQL